MTVSVTVSEIGIEIQSRITKHEIATVTATETQTETEIATQTQTQTRTGIETQTAIAALTAPSLHPRPPH